MVVVVEVVLVGVVGVVVVGVGVGVVGGGVGLGVVGGVVVVVRVGAGGGGGVGVVGVGASAAHGCSLYDVLVIRTATHTLLLLPPAARSGRLMLIVLDPPTHPSHWLNWNI